MKKYEKISLVKFTFIYFFSTAFFVILLGYLYYGQQKNQMLQKYTMKMHDYSMQLKQTAFRYKKDGYSYAIEDKNRFVYQLATKESEYYKKSFPLLKGTQSIVVSVENKIIQDELYSIQLFTIILQVSLIILFLLLSLFLAKYSLKPMNETISHLDRFIKDLIHDLNTPSTSILLNIKMLKKDIDNPNHLKKLNRVENSAIAISSLYKNLEILLHKGLQKNGVDLFKLLDEKKDNCNILYPNITFNLEKKEMLVDTNEKAISRIIDNILSNACKYSKEKDSVIDVKFENKILSIIDNGKGMLYPQKIFERTYTENNNESGHGISMHIVHRLCNELSIDIQISSKEHHGTTIELRF
ncbi:MAG: HAMP domain-containing sensor histidine kinase [Campylobacterota bacterium]|nr:HAMP domain-containing sensor histidine kinase [Campylobacterota bacterium]